MKIVLVGANGTIGELVQKAFAGAGHEIVKVGRPFKWIIHPNWYTTAAFRAKNNGMLGRSNGCITIDPIENNQLVTRLQDGALIYVTVGDAAIEQYL
jgi:hypothetical protein